MLPVKLSTDKAYSYSSLQLIKADLEFARDCFLEADKLGMPNDSILSSKALVFSGVVAYARAYGTGARGISFMPGDLVRKGVAFDLEIHLYLMNLRNKHVAHSVNAFEECDTVGMLAGMPGKKARNGGIGFVMKRSIGLARHQLQTAVEHLTIVISHLEAEIKAMQPALYDEFQASIANGERLEAAPIIRLTDRAKVGEKRKTH